MMASGVSTIEMMTIAVRVGVGLAVDDADRGGGRIEHEGELAALRHQHGAFQRFAVAGLEHARDDVDAERLHHHVGDDADGDQLPVRGHHTQVERHADGEEEQAEQDAAERLDVGFELVAEGRIRTAARRRGRRPSPSTARPSCITSAEPSTTSSAAAVITSRARASARMRKNGLSR